MIITGIQIMPEWVAFFGDPTEQTRGLMVAAQTFGALVVCTTCSPSHKTRVDDEPRAFQLPHG